MKRTLIALGVIAAVAAPLANAAPKVYGKINVTVENADRTFSGAGAAAQAANEREETRVASNASRFGVKGEDELTANVSAIYQIEWEVNTDDAGATGAKTDLTARNRFLGLKHAEFGAIKIGQYDSYLKLAEGKVDQFNDFASDMEFAVAGQDRLKSVIGYESPKVAGLQFNIMAQGQDAEGTNAAARGKNGISSSVVFDDKDLGLYAALAYNKGVYGKSLIASTGNGAFATGSREQDIIRAVASYTVADLTLGALYQQSEAARDVADADDKESAYLVSAAYKLDDFTLKAQYVSGERNDDSVAASKVNKRNIASVGLDYNLTSKTRVISYYSQLEEEGLAAGALSYKGKDKIAAIGLEHAF